MEQASSHTISDDGTLRTYFTAVPNTIIRGQKGRRLTVHAKWLYVYLKSIAGDRHECFQGTRTMAVGAGMSTYAVSSAKQELARAGLITVREGKHSNRSPDHIRVRDIWWANMQEFANAPDARTGTQADEGATPGDAEGSVIQANTTSTETVSQANTDQHAEQHAETEDDGSSVIQAHTNETADLFQADTGVRQANAGVILPNTPRSPEEEDLSPPRGESPTRTREKAARKPPGTRRCPPDYRPSAAVLAWAATTFPAIDVDEAFEAMRDWEFKDTRTDWDAVMRTWIRRDAKERSMSTRQRREEAWAQAERRTNQELEDIVYGRNTKPSIWDAPGRNGQDLPGDPGRRHSGGLPAGPGGSAL